MLKKIEWILILMAVFPSAYANTQGCVFKGKNENNWQYVTTLSLGSVWTQETSAQTIHLAPQIENTYTAGNENSALFDGEIFLGIQTKLMQKMAGQLGLAFAFPSPSEISGDIWNDADSTFNNFDYEYKIRHRHIALKGKLLFDTRHVIQPWISGSFGAAWNKAYGFNNTPKIFEAIKTPNFDDYTETAFTYTLGIGLQYVITEKWQAGIGFEFADWGKSQLDTAPAQTTGEHLKLDHFYTTGFLLNLTYLA